MKRGFTFIELTVVVAIVLILAALVFPVFQRPHEGGRGICQTNLQQIGLGIKQYVQDYNERFPSLATVAGWRDATAIYVKDDARFHCPLAGENQPPKLNDYWFNARLSGASDASLKSISSTLMLGDGYSTTDPRVSLSMLPKSWRDDANSPAQRHLGGANYAFVDGHVKWLKPEKVTGDAPKNAVATFAVR